MRKQGKLVIGDGVRIGTDNWFVCANDAALSIGKNTIVGSYCIFNGGHGLAVGNDCVLAAFVYINSSDHNYEKNKLIRCQGYSGVPVSIGDDVWIGGHALVCKGVRIGSGAVIGGGSVVTRDVSSYSVVAGNPARVIKERT
jgi:acetyltransferase-like isoleucine patch superfamily enzyme